MKAYLAPVVLALLAGCGRSSAPAPSTPAASQAPPASQAPKLTAKITDWVCDQTRGGMAIVEGSLKNTGTTPIEYAELQVRFDKGGALVGNGSGYAEAKPITPGQTTTFRALGPSRPYETCSIVGATSVMGETIHLTF